MPATAGLGICTFLHRWTNRLPSLRIAPFLVLPNRDFQLTCLIEKRSSRSTPSHWNAAPPVTSIPCLDSSSFQRNTSLTAATAASRDADTVLMSRNEMNPDISRAWMSWSSGKDSTLALEVARSDGSLDVVALLTTMNAEADRVAMHAVRRDLLETQAQSLGIRLIMVELPSPCSNDVYEELMGSAVAAAVEDGISRFVFGDIFLTGIRQYREKMFEGTGVVPVFPLWQRSTDELAREMVSTGIRAIITCVDPQQAPREIAGRWYDAALLEELPNSVDPCGENGEFHTFVVDGPGFAYPLDITVGDIVEREGFVFADVYPT